MISFLKHTENLRTYLKPPNDVSIEWGVNQIKDYVQKDIVDYLAKGTALVAECATGFGKTRTALLAMNRIRRITEEPIVVVVPDKKLKADWLKHTALISNVYIYVVNTFTMSLSPDIVRKCALLIVDECHTVLNKYSEYFSNTIKSVIAFRTLLLSATLEENHKSFLEELGINVYYQVTLYWCHKFKLIPEHLSINIPVELTAAEKQIIVRYNTAIDRYSKYFAVAKVNSPFGIGEGEEDGVLEEDFEIVDSHSKKTFSDIAKLLNVKEGVVRKHIYGWRTMVTKRAECYRNAENKLKMVTDMLHRLPNDKVLIFCMSIEKTAKPLHELNKRTTVMYHGKVGKIEEKQIFEAFFSNIKPHLISIRKLKQGFDVPDCRFGIRMAYSSKELDAIQIIGRILRYDINDPNKRAIMFNFYVDDFTLGHDHVHSQEKRWLVANQQNIQGVYWLNYDEIEW